MPVLEVDGKVLAQSFTIARFLAKEHGLAGKDSFEQAEADMYVDCIGDIIGGIKVESTLCSLLVTHFCFDFVDSVEADLFRAGRVQEEGNVCQNPHGNHSASLGQD